MGSRNKELLYDLLSSGLAWLSINHMALEVLSVYLNASGFGLAETISLCTQEQIQVFVSTLPEQMEMMLNRENRGLLSTAQTIEHLWDQHRTSEIEVRRMEIELGRGGDHDTPYTWNVPISEPHLLGKRERGELVL